MGLFNRKVSKPPTNNGPVGQGTRVASPGQGTINGPKQPPTVTQFGNAGTRDIEATLSQVRGWPPNPVIGIVSGPGTRESQARTDAELNTLPAPGRVLRQLFVRAFGHIGPEQASSFPYNAEWSLIPHQFVPRATYRVGPRARAIDDNAPIPPIYAGNPR